MRLVRAHRQALLTFACAADVQGTVGSAQYYATARARGRTFGDDSSELSATGFSKVVFSSGIMNRGGAERLEGGGLCGTFPWRTPCLLLCTGAATADSQRNRLSPGPNRL